MSSIDQASSTELSVDWDRGRDLSTAFSVETRSARSARSALRRRHPDREPASRPCEALGAHAAVEDLHQAAHDAEAQPRAPFSWLRMLVHLPEGLEDQTLVLGGDADAGVAHLDLGTARERAHGERHVAALRELHRV